jgi:periplasmic protein TonB
MTGKPRVSQEVATLGHQNSILNRSALALLPETAIRSYEESERGSVLPAKRVAQPRIFRQSEEIWGHYNNYRANGVAISAVVHIAFIALLVASAMFGHQVVRKIALRETVTLIAPSPDTYTLPAARQVVSGGGGGGEHSMLQAPKGHLPKPAIQQFTPPVVVVRNDHPLLTAEPTVVMPPQVHLAENHLPNLGTLNGNAPMPLAPPSNGTGSGGGIGSGVGSGVGAGSGPGVGTGSGGGIGGGVFRVGGGVSAPRAIDTPDPGYTEEARNAKTQGTCILGLIVDAEGHPKDVRIVRGLGFGLDAKAIEAVKQWRFNPAMKDGKPVNVLVSVEVSFRLY